MEDSLSQRGRSLEEAFFRERDAKLIEERKKLEQQKKSKEELAVISGITNPEILDKLIALGVSPGVLASLSVLPLVEVAWADGKLDPKEKDAILLAAAQGGLSKGSVDYNLLDAWLKERPSSQCLEAWLHYIAGLREVLNQQELNDLKASLLGRARRVAEATGGLMGIGSKISAEEQDILKKMENAFNL